MSRPWSLMVEDVLTYLNSFPAYRALGLNEFRFYDGRVLEMDEEGRFRADILPALAVDVDNLGHERAFEGQFYTKIVTNIGLIYRASETNPSSNDLENAVDVVSGIINSREGRISRLGSPRIKDYDFESRAFRALNSYGTGLPRVWYWMSELTLKGERRILV